MWMKCCRVIYMLIDMYYVFHLLVYLLFRLNIIEHYTEDIIRTAHVALLAICHIQGHFEITTLGLHLF